MERLARKGRSSAPKAICSSSNAAAISPPAPMCRKRCWSTPTRWPGFTSDFLNAGSDVMLAFTYYAHREKLRVIGKEDMLEEINRTALRLARDAASEERRAGRRQRVQLQHHRPRRRRIRPHRARHVRRAGGLGRRRGRGLHRRRDHLLCQRGPARARSDQGSRPAGGDQPRRPPAIRAHAREPEPGGRVPSAWKTQAPMWWGSIARAARPPCCRCWGRSARR